MHIDNQYLTDGVQAPGAIPTRHDGPRSGDEARRLVGVFGSNWIFMAPAARPDVLVPFCYAPPASELTGPTFVGETLLVSVQHPGEDAPINDGTPASRVELTVEMLDLDGNLFTQHRIVPRGSNWPSNVLGNRLGPPRPAVIGIVPRRLLTLA
jgi:secreted PhoX family phosphatase